MSGFDGIKAAREYAATRVVVPTPPETMEERVARLTRERDEARRDLYRVADALGRTLDAEGQGSVAGPTDLIVQTARQLAQDAGEMHETLGQRDEARADLARSHEAFGRACDRIIAAEAEVERLREARRKALALLEQHLGDSDLPEECDETEVPVYWAFRTLMESSRA